MTQDSGPCLCGDPECGRCFPQAMTGEWPGPFCADCGTENGVAEDETDDPLCAACLERRQDANLEAGIRAEEDRKDGR